MLVKWFLAIPHYFLLAFLWPAFLVVTVITGFCIPPPVVRLHRRIAALVLAGVLLPADGGLGTDRYPPFTLGLVARPLMRFMKTTARGAATSAYLAWSPDVAAITGQYVADSTPKTSSKSSYDTAAVDRLWQVRATSSASPPAQHR